MLQSLCSSAAIGPMTLITTPGPSQDLRITPPSRYLYTRTCRPARCCISQASRRSILETAGLAAAVVLPVSEALAATSDVDGLSNDGEALPVLSPPRRSSAPRRPAGPLPRVPKASLAKDLVVSQIIKGSWQLGGKHRGDPASDRTRGAAALEDMERFARAGITTIDTADIYGPSENLVGQYLGLYPREAARTQVLTKLSFMGEDMEQLSGDLVEYRVRGALRRLGVSRIDLLQLHWDDLEVSGYVDAARYLADLQAQGLIHHIGLTNFDVPHMLQVLQAGVPVVSNQVQYSVLDRRAELYMTDLCQKKGIHLLPYGVMAGGLLSQQFSGIPASQAKLNTVSKAKYGNVIKELGGWDYMQQLLKMLVKLSKKHKTTVSAIATKWVLQQPTVPAVIIGARNANHVKEHQAVFTGFELDDIDMLDIDAVYENANQPTTDCYVWERGGKW